MFASIEETLSWWSDNLETQFGEKEGDYLHRYPETVIARLEQLLGMKLHPSVRNVFERVNFEGLHLGTIRFDYLERFTQILESNDTAYYKHLEFDLSVHEIVDVQSYFMIGGTDGYTFYVYNPTGEVFSVDNDSYPYHFAQVSPNIDKFILIAGSILRINQIYYEQTHKEDDDEIIRRVEELLDTHNIRFGTEFWLAFAVGAE